MKLNLDILADYLNYECRRVGQENRKLLYRRPILYESARPWRQDCLYIAATNMLPRTLPANVAIICVGGRIPREWLSMRIQLLHIQEEANLLRVMQDVFDIYDRFDDWDTEIRDIVENMDEIDMERMLTLGISVFRREIILSNHLLVSIFHAVDESGRAAISDMGHTLPTQHLENVKEVCQMERKILHPYLTNMPGLEYNAYCKNLYNFNYFMGCISINDLGNPFRESDFPLMDHYMEHLGTLFMRYLQTTRHTVPVEEELLRDLLEGRQMQMRNQRLSAAESQKWMMFKLQANRNKRYLPPEYMCQLLGSAIPDKLYAVTHNDEVYGLIRLNGRSIPGEVMKIFEDILKRMDYICGLSNPFSDIRDALPYVQQSAYAVGQAESQMEAASPFFWFGDYALQYMLYECTGAMPVGSIWPQELLELQEHDRTKGSEYIKTLRTYLSVECSISRSAELLYVHRNSLIKRLDNIRRILKLDFDDPDVRLLLRICLRLEHSEA